MRHIKTIIPALLCILLFTADLQAQENIKEKDIIGSWKLIIDIEDDLEQAEMEVKEDNSLLGKLVLSSVSGLVTGLLDEIEVYMEFLPKGDLKIAVEAFGEYEMEYSHWYIEDNRLYIENSESYASNQNDYWLLQDNLLVSVAEGEGESDYDRKVFMVKLE